MTFKSIRPDTPLAPLSGFSTLGFSGPDSIAFLQAQTMNDVASLTVGQWHWNGWLTPKGRVVALFALARVGESEWVAVLPDFPASELQALLQRFVFRLKVRIGTEAGWVAAANWPAAACGFGRDTQGSLVGSADTGLGLAISAADSARILWLVRAEGLDSPALPALDDAWLRADMAMGLPRLPPGQREAWTPQMLSLERLAAYSLNKGCYPGQEIVARTHYLGQARRRLSRIAGAQLAESAVLGDDLGATVGTVIRATADGSEGLAVIQATFTGEGAIIQGCAVSLPAFTSALN